MGSFVVAVCQLEPETDPERVVVRAAQSGACLVVLPGEFFTPASLDAALDREELSARATRLAREARCYLVPGTFTLAGPRPGSLERVAWLIGPDGLIIGEQTATHTTAAEEAQGFRRGTRLEVFPLGGPAAGARIGLLVGTDAWIPECSRILTLGGAELLVAPLAMPSPYSELRQIAGVWQEAQQNQTLGLEACLVGRRGDRSFEGRAAVTGPCEMTAGRSGFLARAASPQRPEVISAVIDLEARRKVVEAYDILAEMNIELYREGFPAVYPGAARSPGSVAPGAAVEPPPGGLSAGGSEPSPGGLSAIGSDRPPGRRSPLPLGPREKAFRTYLALSARSLPARMAVRSLGIRPRPRSGSGERPRLVRVAALQMESFYARTVKDYVAWAGRPFREAVDSGARLVAFPELVTLPLAGLIPGSGSKPEDREPGSPSPRLADVARFLEPVLRTVYFSLFSALAAAGQVYVMAGSTPLPAPDGAVHNVQGLFGPDGRLIGVQRKLHLFPREKVEGLSPGSRLEVFTTAVGRVALPICMDATYFETYRLSAFLGAEIVSAPVANMDSYDYWKLLRGALLRVQETPVYAVQSTMVGEFLGEPLTGKASIFAPAPLTPAGDGILAQCEEPAGPGMAVADLDLDALTAFRREESLLARLNPDVTRTYFPAVYETYALRSSSTK